MRNLLSSFEWLNYGFNASNGKNYMLNIYSQYGTNILELESYNVLNAYEEYNSIINFNWLNMSENINMGDNKEIPMDEG